VPIRIQQGRQNDFDDKIASDQTSSAVSQHLKITVNHPMASEQYNDSRKRFSENYLQKMFSMHGWYVSMLAYSQKAGVCYTVCQI
jgi:hypothetical protein